MGEKKPVKLAEWLLQKCLKKEDFQHRIDDLREVFNDIAQNTSLLKAHRWYWWQILRSIPRILNYSFYWRLSMFKNYFKITLRHIKRQKIYSFINISGLAVGMAGSILLFLWVQHELSFDSFHKNGDNVYRITMEMKMGSQLLHGPRSPARLAPAIKEEIPEAKYATSFHSKNYIWRIQYKDKIFSNDYIALADPDIFDIFSFEFVQGDPETALNDPNSIVLTEKTKTKYFGDEDAMGKTININRRDAVVTGIIKNLPENSHLILDGIIPFENWRKSGPLSSWARPAYATYIQLEKNSSVSGIEGRIDQIMKRNLSQMEAKIHLQPLNKIHLHSSHLRFEYAKTGEVKYVYIFSALCAFILLIACINFMNLSTAKASTRIKEIGMRKVIGAEKRQLIRQFFGEALFLSFIAFVLALIIVIFLLPTFNNISGKNISFEIFINPTILSGLAFLILLVGIISGIYPALFLSSFRPTSVLTGKLLFGLKKSNFRRVLVVSQFALSIFLMVCTAIIFSQMQYIKNRDLGYNKKNLVIFGLEYFQASFDVIKNELLQSPYIVSVGKGHQPIWDQIATVTPDWEGKDPSNKAVMQTYEIGYDYFETYQMEILEGRSFSKDHTTDHRNYVVNESAVKAMGLESPVGKSFTVNGINGEIIGVVRDFNHSSLHNPIRPMIFKIGNPLAVAVRINPGNEKGAFQFLREWWKNNVPGGIPFDGTMDGYFLESKLDSFYLSEINLSRLVNYFTAFGVLIACLGLFGLSSFSSERRTKEIGIRKVLGASVPSVIKLLSKEFLILVSLANIIACPAAYYVMNKWMQSFTYRTGIGIWIFCFAAVTAVIIAFISIIYQSIRAATANPVESLRYE